MIKKIINMKKYFTLLMIVCVIVSCTNKTTNKAVKDEQVSLPVYMKIEKPDFESLKPLRLSEFVDSVEYVQLETTAECLLPFQETGSRVGDLLFIGKILVFDITTGKFLRRIGQHGQGPGEYKLPKFAIDEANRKVLINSADKQGTMIFDFNGTYLGHLKDSLLVACYGYIDAFSAGNGYLIYMNGNIDASHQFACVPYELMLYDYINHQALPGLTNRLVCSYNNGNFFTLKPGLQILTKQGDLHYYKSFYNDTLYAVSSKGIYPHAIIDVGKRKYNVDMLSPDLSLPLPSEAKGDGKLFIIDAYIHHNCILIGCLLRGENKTFICRYNMVTGGLTYHTYHIINNIDGGNNAFIRSLRSGMVAVTPTEFEEDYMISTLDKSDLKYPELKDKFEIMQKQRIDEDNPLLMLLHIKKTSDE
jgi:hypothetical protein